METLELGPGYRPNAAQASFHHLARRARVRDILLLGGVGSGKTRGGAEQLIINAIEAGPGFQHIVGGPSKSVVKDASYKAVMERLDAFGDSNGWSAQKKTWNSDGNREILLKNGSTITFLTMANANFSVAGQTVAGFWFDECALSGEDGMQALGRLLERRRAKAGFRYGIYTTTPRGPIGIVQWFRDQIAAGSEHHAMLEMPTSMNRINLLDDHEIVERYRGNGVMDLSMPSAYEVDICRGLSPREMKQQLWAEVLSFEGAVYAQEFDSVASMARNWRPRWRTGDGVIVIAIDWGPNYPHALFLDCGSGDQDVVFDEVCEDGLSHKSFIHRIKKRLKTKWSIDPKDVAELHADPNPEEACIELRRHFRGGRVKAIRGRIHQDVMSSINVVRGRLVDTGGNRRLFFAPDLHHTPSRRRILQCMLLYKWRERSTQQGTVFLDKPLKALHDHGADALRYAMNNRYRWLRSDAVNRMPV